MPTPLQLMLKEKEWLPLDQAIELALYHPTEGYYIKRTPLGQQGDFVTAPEISQLFGEMIALWCLEVWRTAGYPSPLRIVEFGPGRGLMMRDIIILVNKLLPKLFAQEIKEITYHLVEISPNLREVQKETLSKHNGQNIFWGDKLDDLPEGFTLIIANEFFDAHPIKQYLLNGGVWFERGVGYNSSSEIEFIDLPCPPPTLSFPAEEETIYEVCSADQTTIQNIAKRLNMQDGAALIIDYGDEVSSWCGDTLQAIQNHQKTTILDALDKNFGKADITHHIDFFTLKEMFKSLGLSCYGTISQGDFLRQLGIEPRGQQLAAAHPKPQDILLSTHRLISAREMGKLFKVLGVSSHNLSIKHIGFSNPASC